MSDQPQQPQYARKPPVYTPGLGADLRPRPPPESRHPHTPHDDLLVLKVVVPSAGIEMTQTRRFKRRGTVSSVIDVCKTFLNPCFQECPFHLYRPSEPSPLPDDAVLSDCGLEPLSTLVLRPDNEEDVQVLLLRSSVPGFTSNVKPPTVTADMIVIRIEALSRGIEMSTMKKLRRTTTIREIIECCKGSLHPSLAGVTFHLHGKGGARLQEGWTITQCDIADRESLILKPESQSEVDGILRRESESKKAGEDKAMMSSKYVHTGFVKNGFLELNRKGKERGGLRRKKRWCVLKNNRIYYFSRSSDRAPNGYFDLDHCSIDFSATSSPAPVVTGDPASAAPGATTDLEENADECMGKGARVLCTLVSAGEAWTLVAESEAEAKSWYAAVASREARDTSDLAQRMHNASVSGYVTRRARGGGGAQRKWAVLCGTVVYLSESPADQSGAVAEELFPNKIVHYDDRREILVAAIAEGGFVLSIESETEFREWVAALKASLKHFVTSGKEEAELDLISGDVVKSGYLLKKKCLRTFSSYKRRWFALKGSRLFYCHSHNDLQPIGSFDLQHAQANLVVEGEAAGKRGTEARLDLVTTEGVYSLKAASQSGGASATAAVDDATEIKDWCDLIQAHCVGVPFDGEQKLHVDFDYNWTTADRDPGELFEFKEKMGEGAYAVVHRAQHRESGFELAIKILKLGKAKQSTAIALQKEIEVLRKCKSPQIVLYFGTCTPMDNSSLWILTELCRCGSVKDMMKSTLETLSERQLAYICKETLEGLTYLHQNNIIHHDIKAGNILLNEECQVKLADFGVSQQYASMNDLQANDFIGSPLYMSPEVLRKSRYNGKTDIWSLGITVIEMAEGAPPNVGITNFATLISVIDRSPPHLSPSAGWSQQLMDFVRLCLTLDTERRPDAQRLLQHPFAARSEGPSAIRGLVEECMRTRPASSLV